MCAVCLSLFYFGLAGSELQPEPFIYRLNLVSVFVFHFLAHECVWGFLLICSQFFLLRARFQPQLLPVFILPVDLFTWFCLASTTVPTTGSQSFIFASRSR
jgi:hypothetical protein